MCGETRPVQMWISIAFSQPYGFLLQCYRLKDNFMADCTREKLLEHFGLLNRKANFSKISFEEVRNVEMPLLDVGFCGGCRGHLLR